MKIRLLHVFPSFGSGGAQARFLAIAKHFQDRLDHSVIVMDGEYTTVSQLATEIEVSLVRAPVRKGRSIANWFNFRRVLKKTRPDILITHNWGSIEWAAANHPRLVSHIHIEDGFGPEEVTHQLRRRVWARRILLRSAQLVVPSHTLERIAQEQWKLPSLGINLIPNGVDCARFSPDPVNSKSPAAHSNLAPANGLLTIGTVAALRTEKNIQRLIRAFALIRRDIPCQLIIAGGGPERTLLERTAEESGVAGRVVFAGHMIEPESLYRKLDLFGLSSNTEQMPYSVLEAMASGLPVAATDVGDVKEMVAPDNRPYVVARSDQLLAKAMQQLLLDADLRARIGAANRVKASAVYSQDRMTANFERLYGLNASSPALCSA